MIKGKLVMHCNIHNKDYSMLAEWYLKNEFGLECCANEAKTKAGSPSERRRQSVNYVARTSEDREWAKQVKDMPDQQLTPTILSKTKALVFNVHHIYSYKEYENLRYEISNGFSFERNIHMQFHRWVNKKYQIHNYTKFNCYTLLEFFELVCLKNKTVKNTSEIYMLYGFGYTGKDLWACYNNIKKLCFKLDSKI